MTQNEDKQKEIQKIKEMRNTDPTKKKRMLKQYIKMHIFQARPRGNSGYANMT